jgi:hypothetical protein
MSSVGRNTETNHYTVRITVNLVERNAFNDALNDNVITFNRTLKLPNGIAGVGYLLTQLDAAITNTKDMSL